MVFLHFSSLKTKVMRVALLMTHKRIMAKTSGRRSIDADIKPARFIGYCWIIAPHNVEHFFLLLIRFNPGKFFSSMLVGIFEFNFPHISHFLIVRMFIYVAVRFLSLLIFHRSCRLAGILYMYTDRGNVACDLILFRSRLF